MTAWFNPISLRRFRWRYVNFRTHRKIVVCDGRIGFTSGINISAEHSPIHTIEPPGATPTYASGRSRFTDCNSFSWKTGTSPPTMRPFESEFFPVLPGTSAPSLVGDLSNPALITLITPLPSSIAAAIAGAQRQVLLTTPYFVPNEALDHGVDHRCAARVDVRNSGPKRSDSRLITGRRPQILRRTGERGRGDLRIRPANAAR